MPKFGTSKIHFIHAHRRCFDCFPSWFLAAVASLPRGLYLRRTRPERSGRNCAIERRWWRRAGQDAQCDRNRLAGDSKASRSKILGRRLGFPGRRCPPALTLHGHVSPMSFEHFPHYLTACCINLLFTPLHVFCVNLYCSI